MFSKYVYMKNIIHSVSRFFFSLRRPSQRKNLVLLRKRGETPDSILIREAVKGDIPKLSALHVQSWKETYRNVKNPPGYEIREQQWIQQFERNDGSWFCYVAETINKELIGFAMGQAYSHSDLPDYSGELNKIFLLLSYQRLGIGRKLFCPIVQKFLSKGISSMVLFGIPQNPSAYFHEAMDGKKLYSKKGEFHGGYGWKNLNEITSICK